MKITKHSTNSRQLGNSFKVSPLISIVSLLVAEYENQSIFEQATNVFTDSVVGVTIADFAPRLLAHAVSIRHESRLSLTSSQVRSTWCGVHGSSWRERRCHAGALPPPPGTVNSTSPFSSCPTCLSQRRVVSCGQCNHYKMPFFYDCYLALSRLNWWLCWMTTVCTCGL